MDRVAIGPLSIDAPESSSAWWVVDGQQRLTALAATLGRQDPVPTHSEDPFVVYFDAATATFVQPKPSGTVQSTWVPLSKLLDATVLSEWLDEWSHRGDKALKRIAFDAGKRLREYPLPLSIVTTTDENLLREIFYRLNNTGRRLAWDDVHDALFGTADVVPSTLEQLVDELSTLGMGRLDKAVLLPCLLAFRGLDPTQSLAAHRRRDRDVLTGAAGDALPVLRQVLSFLRDVAEIPHARLLPRALPLFVLTRFFAVHPQPNGRTLQILTRWSWRLFLTAGTYDERAVLRKGTRDIDSNEEASAQRLINLLPKRSVVPFEMPSSFDARAAATRVVLIALARRGPRNLETGALLDVARLVEDEQAHAFRPIVTGGAGLSAQKTPANRLIHPAGRPVRRLIALRADRDAEDAVLASHFLDVASARRLAEGAPGDLLKIRKAALTASVDEMSRRLAGWARSDRPSISSLLGRRVT